MELYLYINLCTFWMIAIFSINISSLFCFDGTTAPFGFITHRGHDKDDEKKIYIEITKLSCTANTFNDSN